MKVLLVILACIPVFCVAQCKTFRIGANGDTLNCVDQQDRKQGKWVVHIEALRGEAGYEEEGLYKDDKKEGLWRDYNLTGDVIAMENYRWGNKNGICQYFTIDGLLREESWRAINPDNPYDTIEVPDPADPYKVEMKVVKIDGSSIKHGRWQFFDPTNGHIMKTENYFMGKMEDPNKKFLSAGTTTTIAADSDSTMAIRKKLSDDNKPKEVADFEKKSSKKKSVKIRDGKVGY